MLVGKHRADPMTHVRGSDPLSPALQQYENIRLPKQFLSRFSSSEREKIRNITTYSVTVPSLVIATLKYPAPTMPFRNWQEKRSSILILAAASITIMLFTVVHLRHFLPRRHHDPVPHCNSSYTSSLIECLGFVEESGETMAGKEWL